MKDFTTPQIAQSELALHESRVTGSLFVEMSEGTNFIVLVVTRPRAESKENIAATTVSPPPFGANIVVKLTSQGPEIRWRLNEKQQLIAQWIEVGSE